MDLDNLTFALEGEVYLTDFGKAVHDFGILITRLSSEYRGKTKVEWEVIDIQPGSALIVVSSSSPDRDAVRKIVRAYADVGHRLESGQELNYSREIRLPAERIADLPNGRISSVRFQTPESDAFITSRESIEDTARSNVHGENRARLPRRTWSYGAIEGRVQTLTSRQSLRFTLFDSLHDKAVMCYMNAGTEGQMTDIWDKRVSVKGRVYRDPLTHRPIAIREVSNIRVLSEVEPGQYRRALGAVPSRPDDPQSDVYIRRVRDAT